MTYYLCLPYSEDCKNYCVHHDFCTMYQFDLENQMCKTCATGIMDKDSSNKTSGLCPNVGDININVKILEPKLWCGKVNQKLCNFPFEVDGQVLYEPLNMEGVRVVPGKID